VARNLATPTRNCTKKNGSFDDVLQRYDDLRKTCRATSFGISEKRSMPALFGAKHIDGRVARYERRTPTVTAVGSPALSPGAERA
jgi:hypothetical protein